MTTPKLTISFNTAAPDGKTADMVAAANAEEILQNSANAIDMSWDR